MKYSNFKYFILEKVLNIKEYIARYKSTLNLSIIRKKIAKKIHKVDTKRVPNKLDEIRLFAIMRNEALRLPHFISYYKKIGVNRFFFLDNGSTDLSMSIVQSEDLAHLFYTEEPYKDHWLWMEYLLDRYGKGHWCVVVDIDELFEYPNSKKLSLTTLIEYLDSCNKTAVSSFLLDMYPEGSIDNSYYVPGQNPLEVLRYFDPEYFSQLFTFYDRKSMKSFTTSILSGGMRDRIFGISNPPSILSKISLFKNNARGYLVQGMHAINNSQVSDIQGVVFHTKFLQDFIPEVKEECEREEHFGGAFYYKIFNKTLEQSPNIKFVYSGSVKFIDSLQLLELGLMKTTLEFDAFARKIERKEEAI